MSKKVKQEEAKQAAAIESLEEDSGDAEPDFDLLHEAPKIFKEYLHLQIGKRDAK